jgi:cytoskeletal protein RodZ
MFCASSLLKNTRLDKEWELPDISKKIKVPVKYLEAIENQVVSSFPQEPYCSLIIKDYADYLGLNGTDVLALFRRDFDQKRKAKNKKSLFFSFTPKFTFTVSLILVILFFLVYLTFEYIKFHQPPKLEVIWPLEATVSSSIVEISGVTDSESTVRINDDLILVDVNGVFQKKINLSTGENDITVESTSPNGKTSTVNKVIKSSL